MARSSIGVDIGTRAVRIAEVRRNGSGPRLTRFGRVLLPAGAVEHGEVQDPKAVGEAISRLWRKLGLSGRVVHAGLANRRVVVRVIELPTMSREELEGAIRFQAQEHIPIPLDEAVIDFEVLSESEGPDGQPLQRVLVVAAERAAVESLLEALQAARIEPSTLELNAYPLVRCFAGNGTSGTAAIVDVGAGVTNVVVHHGGKIRFTRILPSFGGDEFTSAVAAALNVPTSEAEDLKRRAGKVLLERLRGEGEESSNLVVRADAPGAELVVAEVPASPVEAAAEIIDPLLDRFVAEVRGSIDFYTTQPSTPPLDRVIVTGGGSLLGGLAERLSAALGVEVERGHPFAQVPVDEPEMTDREVSIAEPYLGVAVGLALAENGG